MAKEKKEKEKKYQYVCIVQCKNCGLVPEEIGPCKDCKSDTFERVYQVVPE